MSNAGHLSSSNVTPEVYCFGPFEADFSKGQLRKGGTRIRVPDQALVILQVLLESNGQLVSREELHRHVWPDAPAVDYDHGLNVMVNRLREALGDSARNPVYIATIPKRGYQFLAPFTRPEAPRPSPGLPEPAEPTIVRAPEPARSTRARGPLVVSAVLLLVATFATLAFRFSMRSAPEPIVVEATNFPGSKDFGALSADGQQLAFAWSGIGETYPGVVSDRFRDIYIMAAKGGTPARLTQTEEDELLPAWSPDGRTIAFLRREAAGQFLYLMTLPGGPERKLGPAGVGIGWSPDGREIVIASAPDHASRSFLEICDSRTGARRRLTNPGQFSDSFPTFSKDGRNVAFIRSYSTSAREVMVVPAAGGTERRLTFNGRPIWGLAWTPGGDIVFSANLGGGESLWRIPMSGGAPLRVFFARHNAMYPTSALHGNRLAFTEAYTDSNIYLRDLTTGESRPLVRSTREDHSPQFSPDGQRIAFVSRRTGSDEIWTARSDGADPLQLTHIDGPASGTPRWSPDGKWIAFDSRVTGGPGIYLIAAAGGQPKRLTPAGEDALLPAWSRDGNWLYFCRRRPDWTWNLWKKNVQTGAEIQITRGTGEESFESSDGKWVYFTRGLGKAGIWRVPSEGGQEQPVQGLEDAGYWRYWGAVAGGLFFVPKTPEGRLVLQFFDTENGRVTTTAEIDRKMIWNSPGAHVTPDRRWFAYTQIDHVVNDIVLIENFR